MAQVWGFVAPADILVSMSENQKVQIGQESPRLIRHDTHSVTLHDPGRPENGLTNKLPGVHFQSPWKQPGQFNSTNVSGS